MFTYYVTFKEKGKEYKFSSNQKFDIYDKVVVNTERGNQLGIITREGKNEKATDLKEIICKATKKDINNFNKNIEEASKALCAAKEVAENLQLNMKFVDASFTLDKNQLLLTFIADNRIDFRTLAKELAAIYKTRIELRQIGVRDKAKEISGIGQCGRKLCCSSFLNNLESVSISMVKNQNLALNPNKINGQCGRLLCCLNYEDDIYTECKKNMPNIGDKIKTDKGEAVVTYIDILNRTYTAVTEENEKVVITLKKECEDCENYNK